MADGRHHARWKTWLPIGIGALIVLVVAVPYIFIHFVQGAAPPPLALSATSSASSSPQASSAGDATTDGTWKLQGSSIVGYRVDEVLFGQTDTAVGRTTSITGALTAAGRTVTDATFTVDMTTVTSDDDRRDEQFQGRIMETSTFPTSTFTLTKPVDFGSLPAVGQQRTSQVTGTLALHGVTKTVTFDVSSERVGSAMQVAGSIPITFADWNISNPSFSGIVTTQDHGVLEFKLNFVHA
jgi:polyisoprenoid-binding protein YceI